MSLAFNLFAYGTLQLPEVFRAVIGRLLDAEPARLADHARYGLAGLSYPGLCREPGAATEGLLYRGLSEREMRCLDEFEDDFYRRERIVVTTADGEAVAADTYVVPPAYESLLVRRPWRLQDLRSEHLTDLLRRLPPPGAPSQRPEST